MASTATIDEQDQERLVSQPESTLLFMSRRTDLRLVKRPRYPVRDPVSGQVAGSTAGEFVGFRDGQFRCPQEGEFKLADSLDGGEAEVDAAELVEWLKKHRLYMNRQEGFWLVDQTAPPVSQDEMRALMQAAMRLDVPVLERIVEQERAGWGRDAIIVEAEAALDEINRSLAEKTTPAPKSEK